jgi:AraC-like DNA-binding protein
MHIVATPAHRHSVPGMPRSIAAPGPVLAGVTGAVMAAPAAAPAPARHTIAIHHVQQILLGAHRLGCDIEALLRRAAISPALLASPSARVTQGQYAALIRSLRRITRDELWGLLSRPVPPGVFAQAAKAMIHCTTLEEAIQAGLRQYRLHIGDFTPRLHRSDDGKTVSVRLHAHAPASPCQVFAESTFVFHAYGLINWLMARRVPLSRVDLSAPPPTGQTDTERVFNTSVRYSQPCTALHFDAAWLRLPVMQDTTGLDEFLREAPHNLLVRYRDNNCLAERIRLHLRSHLDDELPSLEQMAQMLRLTPQTLRRRLRDEGRGYQNIKDSLRRDVAIGMLERSGLTLQPVALRLGFSEPSTFHRAFKKWTGVAPGEYRQRGMQLASAEA